MKSRLLAGVASAAILAANSARAAEPLPPPPPPLPVFSWTGCHVGPHIGLATGRATWQDTQPDGNIDGVAVDGVNGQRTAITDTSGGIYGGQLGCDWQFPASSFVIGIEGTIDGANIEGTNQDEFNAPWTLRNKIDLYGTVTGRLGYAVPGANNVLLYFRGGVVFTDNRFEIENSGVTLGTPSASRTGWTVGAGIEWAFAPAWSLFVEGNYYDTGQSTELFDFVPGFINQPTTINTRTTYETIKLGVNWHFWGLGGPVVARY